MPFSAKTSRKPLRSTPVLYLTIYRTAQAQNKEVGIFPHPFRGNPDRGSKKHRIFAPEKKKHEV